MSDEETENPVGKVCVGGGAGAVGGVNDGCVVVTFSVPRPLTVVMLLLAAPAAVDCVVCRVGSVVAVVTPGTGAPCTLSPKLVDCCEAPVTAPSRDRIDA